MKTNGISDETNQPGDTPKHTDIPGEILLLWQQVRALGFERLELVALETQQAGQSLVSMLVAGIIAAGLLSSAWLGLLATAVLLMVENGMKASTAILLIVAANLLVALILLIAIRRKSRFLKFPATLRTLKPMPETIQQSVKKR